MTAKMAKAGSVNRSSEYRGDDDHYPTPGGATWALDKLKILPKKVWEPACGGGHMSRVLMAAGHDVISTTLVDRGFGVTGVDFLKTTKLLAPAIVTNPPYNIANDFVAHALSLEPDIACFFLRLKWLEGRRRHKLIFASNPVDSVQVFIERVKFFAGDIPEADQPGWNTEAFAWFIWSKTPLTIPAIGWISRDADGGVFG